MTVVGHNSVAGDQLRTVVERIERLEDEKKNVTADIKDVYAEAKGNGFDAKTLRNDAADALKRICHPRYPPLMAAARKRRFSIPDSLPGCRRTRRSCSGLDPSSANGRDDTRPQKTEPITLAASPPSFRPAPHARP